MLVIDSKTQFNRLVTNADAQLLMWKKQINAHTAIAVIADRTALAKRITAWFLF